MDYTYHIRIRRSSTTQWALDNPILRDGEPGFCTDTLLYKIGDGVTPWNSLPFSPAGRGATVDVGLTTTLPPGSSALVTNSGSNADAIFDFEIPEGQKGDKGDKGDTGDKGDKGDKGDPGDPGDAYLVKTGDAMDDGASLSVVGTELDGVGKIFLDGTGSHSSSRSELAFTKDTLNRWIIRTIDTDQETGSNSGSDFEILARADNGGANGGAVFKVRRNDLVTEQYSVESTNRLKIMHQGINYTGTTTPGGGDNKIGLRWVNTSIVGSVDNANSITLGTASGMAYKRSIEDPDEEVIEADLNALRVREYDEYDPINDVDTGKRSRGLIAEEVATDLPQVCTRNEDGTPSSVDYVMIVPLLVQNTQKMRRKMKAQQDEIDNLQSQVQNLHQRVLALESAS